MRWATFLFSLLLIVLAEAQDSLPLAEPCDQEACQLPDCRCASTAIPGGLAPRDTPQFVLVTFDDAVNVLNAEIYRDILYNRFNRDGCPTGTTFFINHEYTDYVRVNELYNQGFEIALHSITHRSPPTFWASATYEDMKQEFADQKLQMAHFANIPYEQIYGVRKPFLQLAGNSTFHVMADYDLQYDLTWVTNNFRSPGLWPYTLDYASIQDCQIPPCPSASIPGVWVTPMISWIDLEGFPCAMVDACVFFPDREDEDAWFEFIVTNFERQYLSNRAPFGFYIHSAYLSAYPAVQRGLVRFMDLINNLNDVFMVNARDVIEWVKNPIPVNEYLNRPCRLVTPAPCPASTCPVESDHNGITYWMQICNTCPRTYPWIGNPLGL